MENRWCRRVNALQRATLISTLQDDRVSEYYVVCQCPPTGNIHFYVQRPQERQEVIRVNALQRATLISTRGNGGDIMLTNDVSMPSNGQHSFLQKSANIKEEHNVCVNALQRATLISTKREDTFYIDINMCQCPPTGNTHFYTSRTRWTKH